MFLYLIRLIRRFFCQLFGFPNRQLIDQKPDLSNSPVISQKAKSSKVKLMNQKTALSTSRLTTQKASLSIKPSFGTTVMIPAFDEDGGDFASYYDILKEFFIMNDVPEEKKTAYLICFIGTQSYKTLKGLCHPEQPKTKTCHVLCHKLWNYYTPKSARFRERSNFYSKFQRPSDSVTIWHKRVKNFSINCRFGDRLEAILLDKFITGMKSGQVLDRLCEETDDITLQKALEIALHQESIIVQL